MSVYYNDSEPFVCAWLRNLITAKLLPAGDVDERPIEQVTPDEVRGYTQAHFFAGIGGWPYALQLAGWGDRPVWTGSCPCQPFSAAGKGQAEDDPRHLWPQWFRLIRECRPERIFGEQVANGAGKGWLDVVATDLEAEAYTVGTTVLGAHSAGAPHLRARIWFVADTRCWGDQHGRATRVLASQGGGTQGEARERQWRGDAVGDRRADMAHANSTGRVADSDSGRCEQRDSRQRGLPEPHSFSGWTTEPDVGRVADGIPGRVGLLRGLGNAIVPQVAAAFIQAYLECCP
jgi:DNA (cytosine-5)-methyltransferase 1